MMNQAIEEVIDTIQKASPLSDFQVHYRRISEPEMRARFSSDIESKLEKAL